MPPWLIVTVAVLTAFGLWITWVLYDEARQKKAWLKQRAASESPAPNLSDLRLPEGATCFRCRKEPATEDGLWCTSCADFVEEYDRNDDREVGDK